MALTDINSDDPLLQQTFADHLRDKLRWDSAYAYNTETFGPHGTLGRVNEREVVLASDLLLPRLMREEISGSGSTTAATLRN